MKSGDFLRQHTARRIQPVAVFRLSILLLSVLLPLHAQWKSIGPFGGSMQTVATDPNHPNIVIAASASGAFFLSRDAGDSWRAVRFPSESRITLHSVVFDPIHPGLCFAGVTSESVAYAGIYRSQDSGVTWQPLAAMRGRQVWSLAVSASGEIASGTESGVYLSHDSGNTWRAVSAGDPRLYPIVSLAFDPVRPDVLYAGTPHLAWKNIGLGARWQPIHEGMTEDSDIFSIAVDFLSPGRIFASACSGVYLTVNGGNAWSKLTVPGGISTRTYFVAPHPLVRGYIYAGTPSGLLWSADGGANWHTISPRVARAIAFDRAHSGRVYIASDTGILRSDDGGMHLTEASWGVCNRRLSRLTESSGAVYGSELEGELPPNLIFLVPGSGRRAEAAHALAGRTLVRSTDFGRSWIPLTAPAHADALLAAQNGRLILAAGSEIFRSMDGGQNWTASGPPRFQPPIRELAALEGSAFSAITDRQVLVSADGSHWRATAGLAGDPKLRGIAGDRTGLLLAATSAGLMRSFDFGASWNPVPGELGSTSTEAVCRNPSRRSTFIAAAYGMVYESVDRGTSWRRLVPEGPAMGAIRQLLYVDGSDRLVALTEAHGAFILNTATTFAADRR